MAELITDILQSKNDNLSLFTQEQITSLKARIITKESNGKQTPYVNCLIRKKEIKLTPEEVVRQLYLDTLINKMLYPESRIQVEYEVKFGTSSKRADIVILDKDYTTAPYIIVELKKTSRKDGKEQLKSYCNGTGAPIAVWTNGNEVSYWNRKDPNYFEDIPGIPKATEKLSDLLNTQWKFSDLEKLDKLKTEKRSLRDVILDMEDEVLANAGVDVFEELFKLIFTKLYDELTSKRNDENLQFRNNGDTESELQEKIQKLFDKAKEQWNGIFKEDDKIDLTRSHLSVCVGSLERVKFFNSNLDVIDDAFEYLINKSSKGEKGQYFTPRYVIDMCVKMLNPTKEETMIDTAAGSCGFPVHTIFYVWKQIFESKGLGGSYEFTAAKKPTECADYVQKKVFAIDFDERAVRVSRTLNLIAGDGQTNVMHLNTLDYERWDERTKDEKWIDTYNEGWKKIRALRTTKDDNSRFNFDIVMANPPFAGDIKESRLLAKYELSKNEKGKQATAVGRDILFIERNLNFLKPGGRMAVVLPQGRFNNSSDKYIRDYIAKQCRILAVVGLHGNVFKPHTGTKTSVLFVQKWTDENCGFANICPRVDDYNIFFATMCEPSKDNSGDKIYVKETYVDIFEDGKHVERTLDEFEAIYGTVKGATQYRSKRDGTCINGFEYEELTNEEQNEYINLVRPTVTIRNKLDSHNHLIVKHDLFNHDGLTQDGIAEAFIEFAKKEKLSFAPF